MKLPEHCGCEKGHPETKPVPIVKTIKKIVKQARLKESWRSKTIGHSDLTIDNSPKSITLGHIETSPKHRGEGSASHAIDRLGKVADKLKKPIHLQAYSDPYDDGLPQDKLEKFYGRHGFVATGKHPEGGVKMTRKPKN